jgi:hypothetical protein|tara:strand:+ start:1023 stop:1430 length:408 start_codon:yes stop_codon:yes gene_type:complete
MASELRVNTLKDASGNNSVATSVIAEGTAKAWSAFSATSTPASTDSNNIASITDNASGRFTMNYTSNMRAAKAYTISGHNADATDVTTYSYGTQPHQDDDVTTSSAEVVTVYVTSNGSGISDKAFNSFLIHGDLA